MFFVFFLLYYNFLLRFGSLKTIRKVLPIDLPGELDISSPSAKCQRAFLFLRKRRIFDTIYRILIMELIELWGIKK